MPNVWYSSVNWNIITQQAVESVGFIQSLKFCFIVIRRQGRRFPVLAISWTKTTSIILRWHWESMDHRELYIRTRLLAFHTYKFLIMPVNFIIVTHPVRTFKHGSSVWWWIFPVWMVGEKWYEDYSRNETCRREEKWKSYQASHV